MTGFLDLPVEIRNLVYDILLHDELEPRFGGVMAVSEFYVKDRLPLRNYRGLLRTCRQIYNEFKQAIQHMSASKQLTYKLTMTFSHGRPYYALEWEWFPGLSATINSLTVNIQLRIREPYGPESRSPHDHELAHLIEDVPENFADKLFDYIAVLLKTLANLLSQGDPQSNVLYTERLVLNIRVPTTMVRGLEVPDAEQRRVQVGTSEANDILDTMQATLAANAKAFQAFDANECTTLSPLIQIGSLQFATEGVVWGEGHNMILAYENFQWLQY